MSKLILEASGRIEELNAQLDELAKQDKVIEAKRKKAGIGCACVFGLLVLSVVGVVLSEGNPVVIGLAVVSFVAFIAMIVIFTRFSSQDLEDRRVDVAAKLFGMLGKDVPPKAKCALTVSFQDYAKHGEMLSKDGGMFSTIVNKVYADGWFLAKGSLHDGNRFQVAIKQTVKRKEKRKRKRTKVTEKLTEDVALSLQLDANSYPKFAEAQNCVDQSAPVAGMTIKSVSQTDNRLKVVATTGTQMTAEGLVNGDRLLAVFMHVYQGLGACRGQGA